MVAATPLPLGTAAHTRLIHFDRILRSNRVALRPHHARAQLVTHLERRLVARHTQLARKLESELPGRLRRHKGSPPEPGRQRRVTVLHDGTRPARHVGLAGAASHDDRRSCGETVGLTDLPAWHAGKSRGAIARAQGIWHRPCHRGIPAEIRGASSGNHGGPCRACRIEPPFWQSTG